MDACGDSAAPAYQGTILALQTRMRAWTCVFINIILALLVLPAEAQNHCDVVFNQATTAPTAVQIGKAYDLLQPGDEMYFERACIGMISYKADNFNFADKFKKSFQHPLAVLSNDNKNMGGGSVVFHGNIFAEGYFRELKLTEKAGGLTTTDLMKMQPWLQWHSETQAYTLEHGHMQAALLKSYVKDGKVTIYRGLGAHQMDQIKRLQAGDKTALAELFSGTHDALFFTPDLFAAKKWADGYYIEITLDEADIEKLYTGIEYNYVEIAMPDPALFQKSLATLKATPLQRAE